MKTILFIIWIAVLIGMGVAHVLDALESWKIKRMPPYERMVYLAEHYGRQGYKKL
jgi:hypothetical protein